ncbi:cyclophilin-like fold protein [Neptuniibacter halophilus]|uniref:cyclophilin-like fold protein n=1 Tax=Neptuniibacter halophilus TaxID=651666 RepID=UPI00257350FC|nr:cyclophilin-like fold protein [Neptuniibacter halophilus]
MKIELVIGQQIIPGTLDNTPAASDFCALLPLTLRLKDYHQTEKIADLPKSLSQQGSARGYKPEAGDITYYAPWGNLAIFYKPFSYSTGLLRLGQLNGEISALTEHSEFEVTFRLAE